MSDYALYRLPEKEKYHSIVGDAKKLNDISEIEGQSGFVFAPFNIKGDMPLMIIDAKTSEEADVPVGSDRDGKLNVVKENRHRDEYHNDFDIFHDCLDNGTVEKIVLARRLDLTVDKDIDAKEVFFTACRMYPHQMIALISTEESGKWLMASPEVLIEKSGDSWKTMALAGTMTTPGPWSEKNRREQNLVERYILNCLGRYCYVIKRRPPKTVSAAKLYHLRTDFEFYVNNDSDAIEVLSDLHPTPAVCGIPKDKALDIILNNESIDRKYYSGFCGPFGVDGENHLFVSLRCMEIEGCECHLYAGGGLLQESDEETEWNETEVKLKTMKDVLG